MSGPLRVLFVEDHPDQSTLFAIFLGNFGCHVVTAPTGSQALSLAPVFQPHLVFTDLGLPDMSGIEVANLLRERCEPIPLLVALTGQGEESRAAWHEMGFEDYVLKPITKEKVLEILLKAQYWRERMESGAESDQHYEPPCEIWTD